jgi:ATP-dependent 26S proteasome regulatory subunit
MDGFDSLGKTKLIMATNRPDTLDPALLRPGRLDRKIEIPLPNEQGRLEILKIHAKGINKSGDIDYEAVVKLSDGFNGADLRNVCTEAGMFAIREDRYVSSGRRPSFITPGRLAVIPPGRWAVTLPYAVTLFLGVGLGQVSEVIRL